MHPSLERDVMKLVPAFGIYVLAGVLRDYGHEVEVYDYQILLGAYEEAWDEALIKDIVADADIVGLSSNSFSWGVCRELIEVIKSEEHSPYVVCGGIHPTFFDIYVLETTKADAVILGEGEKVSMFDSVYLVDNCFTADVERFGAVIGLNWWLPLKSSMTDNVQKYGVNIAPSVYDNPLWENDFEFLKTTYKSLSISDIDYIGNKYNKYITNLVDML